MAHPRTFRFAAELHAPLPGSNWVDSFKELEDLGYSTLFMPDHFGAQLSPTVALQAAADATTTLRVGALVYDNDYRHPVVLAKDCATLDLLSGPGGWRRTTSSPASPWTRPRFASTA